MGNNNLLPNMNLQSIEIIIYDVFLRNRSHKYLWQYLAVW